MKNITVSVDDETYRRARIKAAERDTSVSGLVKRFLTELAAGESDVEQLNRQERALQERIVASEIAYRVRMCTGATDEWASVSSTQHSPLLD